MPNGDDQAIEDALAELRRLRAGSRYEWDVKHQAAIIRAEQLGAALDKIVEACDWPELRAS